MEALLRRAVDSEELQLNSSEQVVFTRTGRTGLMRVVNPLSFLKLMRWQVMQPDRSVLQAQQAKRQIDLVERLIAAELLSATYDQY